MLLKLGKSPDWCATPCSYAYFTYLYTLVCFLLSHVASNRSRVYSLSHRYAFPFIPVSRCLLYTNLFKSSKILWAFYDAISCKAWLAYCSFRLKVPIGENSNVQRSNIWKWRWHRNVETWKMLFPFWKLSYHEEIFIRSCYFYQEKMRGWKGYRQANTDSPMWFCGSGTKASKVLFDEHVFGRFTFFVWYFLLFLLEHRLDLCIVTRRLNEESSL